MSKKSFSIVSLGCFRNNYDSLRLKKQLLEKGFNFKESSEKTDTIVINTCGFIDSAKEESLAVINEALDLKRKKKVKKIVVVGCLVERYRKELESSFKEVDEWQGVFELKSFSAKLKETENAYSDFLKICEGCLNRCSFCTIPDIKGPLKSRVISDILKEVRYLDKHKLKELNLIGQDITSWGKDLKPKKDLVLLLKKILRTSKHIGWIRLIYTHPRHLTDSLIELIAKSPRICKYIDLPIQHINDKILRSMGRKTTKKDIVNLLSKIRKKIPNCAIRTSVIVGFPGEGEKEFKELLQFLKDIQFERLGAFTYSQEEGTPAYNFKPQVNQRTKLKRKSIVMNLQKQISAKLNQKFIGQELDVLVEEKRTGFFLGRTQFDAPEVDGVVFIKKNNLKIGDFYRAKIVDAYDYDLVAI
ncbi:MAG: MiaB/RimO family radical SAM methylthiotransferase [Candidatus Omnitrophica bacterium]|nr:MiaB/RimO family radical SAM methylthiotransferase [Candidatus Omnitrophota bacterium]